MADLESLLSNIDPMPPSRTPGASSLVGADIYRDVQQRGEAPHGLGGAGGGSARRSPSGSTSAGSSSWSARRTVVVGLVVVISAGLVATPLVLWGHGTGHLVRPGVRSVTSIPAQPPSAAVSHRAWPTRVLGRVDIAPRSAVLVSEASASAASSEFLVGVENDGCMEPCSEPLVRFDPWTGSFKRGPVMSADTYLETVGSGVVALTAHEVAPDGTVSGGWSLRAVDVDTLGLGQPVNLPFLADSFGFSITGPVRGTDDFWIGSGQRLWLVDAVTGAVVQAATAAPYTGPIALSSDGRFLYDLEHGSGGRYERDVLEERSGATGRVLAHVKVADPWSSASLTAADGGAWVATDRSVRLFSSQGLRAVALPGGVVPFDPPTSANLYQGVTVYGLGSFVLLETYRGMTCLAPGAPVLRAATRYAAKKAPGWTPVAVAADALLAIATRSFTSSIVYDVHIPATCVG